MSFSKDKEIKRLQYQNIFTPGIYHGRDDDEQYGSIVNECSLVKITQLVKRRAEEDGQWCIDMELVGDNEDKMLKMIEYVSDEERITDYIGTYLKETRMDVTVDYLCRDLANQSKWAAL